MPSLLFSSPIIFNGFCNLKTQVWGLIHITSSTAKRGASINNFSFHSTVAYASAAVLGSIGMYCSFADEKLLYLARWWACRFYHSHSTASTHVYRILSAFRFSGSTRKITPIYEYLRSSMSELVSQTPFIYPNLHATDPRTIERNHRLPFAVFIR